MVKGIYVKDVNEFKNTLLAKMKGDPVEAFNMILSFSFDETEIKIYDLLLTTSLTIKELEEQLDVSERSIRKYIKRLEEEGLITKRVEEGKRLKYVYQSLPIQEAWKKVAEEIRSIINEIADVMGSSSVVSRSSRKR